MDYLQRLVVACFLASGSAHAAHATLSPPAGWSAGGSASWATPSNSFSAQTANQWINNAAKTSAMLNIGGKQVAMQVHLGLAPSAPRAIAAAIFMSPQVRTAVGIATLLNTAKLIYDDSEKQWKKIGSPENVISDGYEYYLAGRIATLSNSPSESCKLQEKSFRPDIGFKFTSLTYAGNVPSGCVYTASNPQINPDVTYSLVRRPSASCPAGWHVTPAGCTSSPQPVSVTQKEMVDLLNPDNHVGWPTTLPNELPLGTPLPVKAPVVNPGTGVNPFPKPLYIPTGDPVKNPKYDSTKPQTADNQPFIQPGVNVTPRPTTANPWQVDIQPVDRPQAGAEPLPEDQQNPDTQEGDKPKDEDTKSLCEKHPDILACQKVELGSIEPDMLLKNTVSLQINREEGFGPADGACPAPKQFTVMGKSMAFQWDLLCDFAGQIRPLLIGFAYLSAALAFFGLSRKD